MPQTVAEAGSYDVATTSESAVSISVPFRDDQPNAAAPTSMNATLSQ
ncbi:MAG: hypothetical protein OEO77_02710 [Acidimicrobiia bacterium]|nr:hypothetical protein [Acidimicrobiia bacterium]